MALPFRVRYRGCRRQSWQAWVAPADSDAIRVAINGALCISRTDDGGKTWKQLRNGLPQQGCFDIVYRHALATSGDAVAFGTTTGNLFVSPDRGENWQVINNYLPCCILFSLLINDFSIRLII